MTAKGYIEPKYAPQNVSILHAKVTLRRNIFFIFDNALM